MTGSVARSRSGAMHLTTGSRTEAAEREATVRVVLARVADGRYSAVDAATALEALGLLEVAWEMAARRKGARP